MDMTLAQVVVSSLLHDIGKFAQRARRPYSKSMVNEYLTYHNGRQGHWHTVYTDYFIENDLVIPDVLENDRSRIARMASAHHNPDTASLTEMAIHIADWLSSGTDRIPETETGEVGFREARLLSVFDEVELGRNVFKAPGRAFHKLTPLDVNSEDIFPTIGEPKGNEAEYSALFDGFMSRIPQLPRESVPLYLGGLKTLLENYTWCIPSSAYNTLPDVSLYDHALSTAAIAQALYCYHTLHGGVPKFTDEKQKFILLGGDYSGIQNYIFNISKNSGRGVSKIFRARSFYLQILQRSILFDLHRRLKLLPVTSIVESGGKFILLLPFSKTIEDTIDVFETDLQQWFRNAFKGQLTLNISWAVKMRQQDFLMPRIQERLDDVNDALEIAKSKKLLKTIKINGPVISHDYEAAEGGNCGLCSINNNDAAAAAKYAQKMGIETKICADCFQQIDYVGERLPKSNYIAYDPNGVVTLFGEMRMTLMATPPASLTEFAHIETMAPDILLSRIRLARYLPEISTDELTDAKWFEAFSKESEAEVESGQTKTFGMIALKAKKKIENKLVGRPLLGFFKADVDDLGLLFSIGLREKVSIARYATMSRMLNLFFSDYLVALVQNAYPDIYVVFAGGDDLFLVGPIWQIIEFSLTLRDKFSAFCADNPDITLSAGILAGNQRLPMRKAADLVEANLEKAKHVDTQEWKKNSVCFLDETHGWDELKSLLSLGRKFDQAVESKNKTNFTTAFLYRLYTYHRMYRKFVYEKQIQYGRYLSLAHYDIGRNLISDKANNRDKASNQDEVKMLQRIFAVGVGDRPELNKLNVPLFYAINRNRESQ